MPDNHETITPAGTDTGSATAANSFKVRFSRQSTQRNSLKLSGNGEIVFTGDTIRIHGKKNRFLGLGSKVDFIFQKRQAINLFKAERSIRFNVFVAGGLTEVIHFQARDESEAQRIADALPKTMTAEAIKAAAELQDFQSRLSAISRKTWATPSIIGANVIVFALAAIMGAGIDEPNPAVLLNLGTNYGPLTESGQWWRLGSSMFLHFGILHLALNMWALYNSGKLVERLYGSAAFLIIYITAGLSGSFASLLWNAAANSAGASGAIFGIFGAMVAFFARKDTMVPMAIVQQQRNSGLAFIGYNLLFGFTRPGIDNSAHIGGLLAGALMGFIMARPVHIESRSTNSIRYYSAALYISVTLLLGLFCADRWLHPHPAI